MAALLLMGTKQSAGATCQDKDGSGFTGRQLKPIPKPRLGENVTRLGGIWLYFFPQLIDQNMQIFHFAPVIRTPDSLQYLCVGYRNIRIRNQVVENLKLLRS